MTPLPHYCARRMSSGWGFTTPSGQVPGFLTEPQAQRIAEVQREQDLATAYSDFNSPIAATLRAYFDEQTQASADEPEYQPR